MKSDGNASVIQMDNRACVEMAVEELCDGNPNHLAFISAAACGKSSRVTTAKSVRTVTPRRT